MKYVIRYKDGSYNQGSGFPCRIEEATLYGTRDEAVLLAEDLMDVQEVQEFALTPTAPPAPPAPPAPCLTLSSLIDAIEAASRTIKVCVPSQDYYRRKDEWTEEDLTYVDPTRLIEALKDCS